jgi:hypothetical protein
MKIPKEFEDSPFEYIEYLEKENNGLIEDVKHNAKRALKIANERDGFKKENEELRGVIQRVIIDGCAIESEDEEIIEKLIKQK